MKLKMTEPLFRRMAFWLAYLVAILSLFAAVLWHYSGRDFAFDRISWSRLALAFVAQLASMAAGVVLWRLSVHIATGRWISSLDAILQTCLNLLAKYIPGKIWGFAARHQVLVSQAIQHGQAAMALTLEQFAFAVTGCALSAPLLFLLVQEIPRAARTGGLAILATGIVLLVVGLRHRAVREFAARIKIADVAWLLVISGVQWLLTSSAMLSVAWSLDVALVPHTVLLIACAVPASVLVGMIAVFAPGGIVVREGVFVLLCGSQIGVSTALACALLLRLLATARDAAAGLAVPAIAAARRGCNREA